MKIRKEATNSKTELMVFQRGKTQDWLLLQEE
jgi:hypothetical protein